MKKILFIALLTLISNWAQGQKMLVDTISNDSVTTAESFVSFNPDQVTKAAGDSAYLRNDFQTAIQIYEALLKQGEAAEVYYNLGNSYYKINDIAHAILNYERALLLSPGNNDIRANLEIARAKTIDKIASIPDIFFIGWFKTLINSLSIDAWSYLAIVCFVFFLLCLGLFFYSKSVRGKKIGFISGFILLIVVILCNVFALQQKKNLTNRFKAIVIAPSVTVHSTPSESGTNLFILHEGHKVEIKDNTMHEWKEIRLEDGKVGWLPSSAIEVI